MLEAVIVMQAGLYHASLPYATDTGTLLGLCPVQGDVLGHTPYRSHIATPRKVQSCLEGCIDAVHNRED